MSAPLAAMKPPRRTSTPSTPRYRTRRWSAAGTASEPDSSMNRKMLSTLRAFSSRQPAKYWPAIDGPCNRKRTPPKASPATIHQPFIAAATRPPAEKKVRRDEQAHHRQGRRPGPPRHRHRGLLPAAAGHHAGAGPAAQRGQYRLSGMTVSSPAGITDPHCSQRPKLPAVSRPRASSTSASSRRASTARRKSIRSSRGPGWPSPPPCGASASAL